MPGIVAHHVFGTDVYARCAKLIGDSHDALDAFLLGNLGPDPFFYLMATPMTRKHRRLGQLMHKKRTPELLCALHEHFVAAPQEQGRSAKAGASEQAKTRDAATVSHERFEGKRHAGSPDGELERENAGVSAYALGFLCHYLLDSTVHPLVYAQQHAICNARLEGVSFEWSHRVVHATIETALDEYVLTARLGATAATLPPHKTMLRCPLSALVAISHAFSPALADAYDLKVPETTFVKAVSLNRLAQQALDSKSAGLRQRFDYLEGFGMASAYVQALSHRAEPREQTPFANDDHTTWEIPFSDGKTVSASFDELRSQALERACELLPAYAEPELSFEACEELVGNVNFLGRAVER